FFYTGPSTTRRNERHERATVLRTRKVSTQLKCCKASEENENGTSYEYDIIKVQIIDASLMADVKQTTLTLTSFNVTKFKFKTNQKTESKSSSDKFQVKTSSNKSEQSQKHMLDIFSGLRLVIKRRSYTIDGGVFRLHWFLTSTLLVSMSLIITARQYVGQPIECHSVDKIPETLLNSYCWVQNTFTIPQACNVGTQRIGVDVPYPCIDNTRGREIKVFAYYQWVGIVLFIQGVLFHMPYYMWKLCEGGLIRAITSGLKVAVLGDADRDRKKFIVIEYLRQHKGCHNVYFWKYFACEILCLTNLAGQLWATNKFFDGQFYMYGIDVIIYLFTSSPQAPLSSSSPTLSPFIASSSSLEQRANRLHNITFNSSNQSHRIDPMTFIFPRITKCTYFDFGSSGDIQRHDALCLLPLNIVNEKIYIALWFWFLLLALLTIGIIIVRLSMYYFATWRPRVLSTKCKLCRADDLKIVSSSSDIGDWFLMYMIAGNIDPIVMRDIVAHLAEDFRESNAPDIVVSHLGDDLPEKGTELDQYCESLHLIKEV
ncbi:Innexin shaking-B, partial [Fragariocoptes setiger]